MEPLTRALYAIDTVLEFWFELEEFLILLRSLYGLFDSGYIVLQPRRRLTTELIWCSGNLAERYNGLREYTEHKPTNTHTQINKNKENACGCQSGTCAVSGITRAVLTKTVSGPRAECLSCMMMALWHVGVECRLVRQAQSISNATAR